MTGSNAPGSGLQTAPKAPILALTSVRIFAALYVVLHHYVLWTTGFDVSTWHGRFVKNGYTAVGFFFTLSGYILAHVYLNTDRPFSRRAFWTSRFARVYPLLFASLLLDVPRDFMIRISLHGLLGGLLRGGIALFSESILLQAWSGAFRNINSPSWSLSAEAFFYLLFPLIALPLWQWKRGRAVALFFLLWMGAMAAPLILTALYPSLFIEVSGSVLQQSITLMPIFRIFEFLAGISVCAVQHSLISRLPFRQRKRLVYPALVGACALFILAIQWSNHIPLLLMSNGLLLPVYGLTLLGLVNLTGPLQRLLSHKILVLFGEVSYAVYLLHSPIFFLITSVHSIGSSISWLPYITLVLTVSIASFYLLERPVRKRILEWASIRPSVTLKQEMIGTN